MDRETHRLERDQAGIFLTRWAEPSLRESEKPRKVENHCLKAANISNAPVSFSQRTVIAASHSMPVSCLLLKHHISADTGLAQ